jgi:hypothetical protein
MASSAHDALGIRDLGICEKAAMTAIMSMNMHTVLRGMLDAFVSSWMRQAAAEAEQARPRTLCR